MALDIQKLAAEVARVESVHSSAIKAFDALRDELRVVSAKLAYQDVDTSAIDELIQKLDVSTDALASAIATTPAPVAEPTSITITPFDGDTPPPADVGH